MEDSDEEWANSKSMFDGSYTFEERGKKGKTMDEDELEKFLTEEGLLPGKQTRPKRPRQVSKKDYDF